MTCFVDQLPGLDLSPEAVESCHSLLKVESTVFFSACSKGKASGSLLAKFRKKSKRSQRAADSEDETQHMTGKEVSGLQFKGSTRKLLGVIVTN